MNLKEMTEITYSIRESFLGLIGKFEDFNGMENQGVCYLRFSEDVYKKLSEKYPNKTLDSSLADDLIREDFKEINEMADYLSSVITYLLYDAHVSKTEFASKYHSLLNNFENVFKGYKKASKENRDLMKKNEELIEENEELMEEKEHLMRIIKGKKVRD